MTLVSGSGPFPEGTYFEYGTEELTKLHAEIVDEHYYQAPAWFKEHATRYDNYDRQGPKIFADEYAAQSVATVSPKNENNWDCALAEAAFMTGLERNADMVYMTSYAPLLAHAEGWQWTPDLIWFNNLEAYGTANYYVQKLFSTHKGTDLLSVSSAGQALTGQEGVYASAVMNKPSGELYLKLVNVNTEAKKVEIKLKGKKVQAEGTALILKADALAAVNSFENPTNISPTESGVQVAKDQLGLELEGNSLTVVRLKIK